MYISKSKLQEDIKKNNIYQYKIWYFSITIFQYDLILRIFVCQSTYCFLHPSIPQLRAAQVLLLSLH